MIIAGLIGILLARAPEAGWIPVEISYYETGRITADGTPMCVRGEWVATRKFPLGSVVEIEYGGKVLRLPVKDKTAERFGHRADLPRETWRRFGEPTSRGILRGRWRRVL